MRVLKIASIGIVMVLALHLTAISRAAEIAASKTIAIPGGEAGIGFDDMGYSSALGKVIVPAGRTGTIALIEPGTDAIEVIGGFTHEDKFGGGHGESVTSADMGAQFMLVTDRSAQRLDKVDVASKRIIASAPLAAEPDYVRYVAATGEVWVTEPEKARIEIFALAAGGSPKPAHAAFIEVPGGPEALVIDNGSGRAYANRWTDSTVAIDLRTRAIVAQWPNGCAGSRGLAMDAARSMLFVGCKEGKLAVLDLKTGKRLGIASSGSGVDIIAYDARLGHAYLPGAASATMAVIGIEAAGAATVLGTVATAKGAHCAASDESEDVYVCDPATGRILAFKDSFAPTK